jgi:hypothetical protein
MPMNPRLLVPRATFDADAAAYLRAVEAADGQALETPVKRAVDDFFRGTKADGTFSALKAACILCGARTLAGALVPLAGTAPTNNNFVDADYNRETGLVGNGSTKYLDSNRAENADPQNDAHISAFLSSPHGVGAVTFVGSQASWLSENGTNRLFRRNSVDTASRIGTNTIGFLGASRISSASLEYRVDQSDDEAIVASRSPFSNTFNIFRYINGTEYTDARMAFYSIGESLDLALLDARVTALVTAIGAAL